MIARVVMNEQHSLLPEQEQILMKRFDSIVRENIPAEGLSAEEMHDLAEELVYDMRHGGGCVVFLSPVPALMKHIFVIAKNRGVDFDWIKMFHNDHREKKELPNGRIIHVVAKTGWQLI